MFLGSSEWGMLHLLKGASTEMEARLEREREVGSLLWPCLPYYPQIPGSATVESPGLLALGTVAKRVSQAQRRGVAWRTHFPLTCRGVIEVFPANVI